MSTTTEVAAALRGASSVVVCAHVNPDGDAIGSVLALALALNEIGVPAIPTLADEAPAPRTYAFLPGFETLRPATGLDAPEVFVSLDTPNFSRLGVAEPVARTAKTLVVIDHHPDNAGFGTLNLCDSTSASTSQLVWRLLPELGVAADSAISTCAYVGLVTDTGRFQYSNATARSHRDAADMIDVGVDVNAVYERLYEERSPAGIALIGRVISRITLANGGDVAYSWITDDDLIELGAGPEETENLIDSVRTLGGISVAVLMKEGDGETRANLRAKANVDVAQVARSFGGGGHVRAAGFTFAGSMSQLLPQLLAELPGA